jgi:bacillolysin
MRRTLGALVAAAALVVALQDGGTAQRTSTLHVRSTALNELRAWDRYVTQESRSGSLRVRLIDRDPALPARTVERYEQLHRGVRVWGAEIVRDSEQGVPHSIFGMVAQDLTLSIEPGLHAPEAGERLRALGGAGAALRAPELVILPLDSGEHRLAYTAIVSNEMTVMRAFVDAHTGGELLRLSEISTQAAVGSGRGVSGDLKKLSVSQEGGAFFADDRHRPPVLRTYDFRGDTARAVNVLNGAALFPADRASDADNTWSDAGVVDAHVHIGWSYDYYFKRHGRRGLDGRDRPTITVVNAVTPQAALSLPPNLGVLVDNAFWCGGCGPSSVGVMYLGSGVPPTVFSSATGQTVRPLAAALDIAAHELTHGVIDSSSRLIGAGEPGALNEAFADMMGTSVEFFFQPAGTGLAQADYVLGEDAFRALRSGAINGIRAMDNPQAYPGIGAPSPDHYSRRYTGPLDDGGEHVNAGIPGHAFYLAIEGGTNRTSGLAVQGVGGANREQIEKVFYRAFVFLLTPTSNFSTARAATIQAARDLYGAGSAAERAVTQAWTAVGVL